MKYCNEVFKQKSRKRKLKKTRPKLRNEDG